MSIKAIILGAAAIVLIAALASAIGESADLSVGAPDPVAEQPADGAAPASGEPDTAPGSRVGSAGGHERSPIPDAEGAASAAGAPARVARGFALAWINRPMRQQALARQNRRLVSLAHGFWADQLAASMTRSVGSGSQGTVVGVDEIGGGGRGTQMLVTTREQLAPPGRPSEPYHYGLYLARLERVAGGFAVSSWEPQF